MRLVHIVRFVGLYLYGLAAANVSVALEVLRPDRRTSPAIVALPLRTRTPWKVVALAHLISLQPGTLTLDVAEDLDVLYVHALEVGSADDLRARLDELQTRLLEVTG